MFWVEPFEISCPDAIGEESEIADHSEIFIRNVADQGFDEINNRQRFFLKSMGGVVQEGERDGLTVIRIDSGFSERRFFEIFAEIVDGYFGVVLSFLQVDDPGFLIMLVEPFVEGGQIFKMVSDLRIGDELVGFELVSEEVNHLVSPHALDHQVVDGCAIDIFFGFIDREPADGCAEMDVNIKFEVPAIRVKSEKNAREIVFAIFAFFTDIEDNVGGQAWDEAEELSIGSEEVPEFIRHGEGDVLIADVWESVESGVDPGVSSRFATRGAESGFAGVWDFFIRDTIVTDIEVKPEKRGSAGEQFCDIFSDGGTKMLRVV